MRALASIRDLTTTWIDLEADARATSELLELAIVSEDEDILPDIEIDINRIHQKLEKLDFELRLSGKHDRNGAILAIHAGAGGTESQDWSEMLLKMYLRWAEKRDYTTKILDMHSGEEAGIKSVHLEIIGEFGYGYLKGEAGAHRLVRLSPFDADKARHTSFAKVEILPDLDLNTDVTIDQSDLRIDYFKSSGAGGQSVQKNSTAVRIVHIPTNITVTCQNERSQRQNRETAMKILQARLTERELTKQAQDQARLKGEHVEAEWGNQIRSYILHPYQMVKDHRSSFETSDTEAVLDGNLDELIENYLKHVIGAAK